MRFLSLAVVVGLLVACSSAPTPSTKSSSKSTPPSGGDNPPSGTTPSSSTADSKCQAKSDCVQCCVDAHSAGNDTFNQLLNTCLCASAASCKKECSSTICSDPTSTPSDACATCSAAADSQGGPCFAPVDEDCKADKDCAALGTCIEGCN